MGLFAPRNTSWPMALGTTQRAMTARSVSLLVLGDRMSLGCAGPQFSTPGRNAWTVVLAERVSNVSLLVLGHSSAHLVVLRGLWSAESKQASALLCHCCTVSGCALCGLWFAGSDEAAWVGSQ